MAGQASTSDEVGGKGPFGEATAEPIDLNLTALMDILSNLLFFLLASFGATVLMAINVSVPVQAAEASDVASDPSSVTATVRLAATGIEVAATGPQDAAQLAAWKKSIPLHSGDLDFAALTDHLRRMKEKYPKSETMVLLPERGVRYDALVRAMDAAREDRANGAPSKLFPQVVVSTVVK
ncbi:MAG: biopolymer transporter ExbD [Deltaproteobacteria bacterium]|nr:biopolymer transporter ExbD [Deltaproteobacteria bacterium]